jgi:hypothetical protein
LNVPRINWDQIGRTGKPGRYELMFGWVTVTDDDLGIWSKFPRATFALYETGGAGSIEYRLGSVNLNAVPAAAP